MRHLLGWAVELGSLGILRSWCAVLTIFNVSADFVILKVSIMKKCKLLTPKEVEGKMRKQTLVRLSIAGLALGVSFFVAPSVSQAVIITGVSVTVGGTTFCDTTSACAN